MISNLLEPEGYQLSLPVAKMRPVFDPDQVRKKLEKLQYKEGSYLRNTYEQMLDRGPERFQVKPSGVPGMSHLYDLLPNFREPLDDVKRSVLLTQDSQDGLEIAPMLLLGPPGIGKTHFAQQLAKLLGTGTTIAYMSSMTAGWLLSGSSSQWQGAKPGKVFEAVVEGVYANPVIVVDEIDKASAHAQYDPLGPLYTLLEQGTSQSFTDEFAEVAIDASQVIWITTANDPRGIPEPIMNRMNVFEIKAPDPHQARAIATNLYKHLRNSHDWGKFFEEEPRSDFLDALSEMPPRSMEKAIKIGFGNAKDGRRSEILVKDLPKQAQRTQKMGFVQ